MVPYFYNGVIRKYIIMFGRMFNDIDVVRYDNSGNAQQTLRVPIAYGPAEKFLTRINQDPRLDREVAIQLPRLAFELTSMNYAPTRGLNKTQKYNAPTTDGGTLDTQYVPTPYDFNITLYGMFANNEDAVQVTEQILPFFRPEWTMSMKPVSNFDMYWDIPTILNDMSIEDSYEGDFESRRAIIYTWNFTMKGYLFGPVRQRGIIKRSIIDLAYNATGESIGTEVGPQKKIVLTPGLTSDGEPTTDVNESIAWENISVSDNWDYAFESLDYFDGVNRHDH